MRFIEDDGGRWAAGFRGSAGDCACRAVAIATGKDYWTIYDALDGFAEHERPRGKAKRSHPRTGYASGTLAAFLDEAGWEWVPTVTIGSGCKVHLRADELPPGRLIVRLSRHYAAVIDGVIHDTYDPSRDGTRCVYGYWKERAAMEPQGGVQ